jgi:Cu(I)/Ag(I) efflux system membrane fusion protein
MPEDRLNSSNVKRFFGRAAAKLGFFAALVVTFFIGFFLNESLGPEPSTQAGEAHDHSEVEPSAAEVWTCSMHPQIQLPKPGLCPICGMTLIPLASGDDDMEGSRRFTTTLAAKELMNIQTSAVERRFVPAEIRMVGKVDYDETKLGYITAWVPGRLDRLYVDYTGVQVKKGDHMVYLYSPDLLAGQDELRRAAENVKRVRSDSPETLKRSAKTNLDAARDKLRRWGLTDSQIDEAERTGISSDHITVYAPMGGTVIHRSGQEGMYVQEGTNIYTIADLSKVWLLLDAYESDLAWLHLGQTVEFYTEAYPGDLFSGKITFIDPVLDRTTRTIKVRVNVPNEDGRLKPEMFARVIVRAQVATGGRVMDPGLVGKWMGPMHPEIVKDDPGACDICGMALVKAEDLGYVPAASNPEDMPLVIPASAPLLTGKRAVVYVEVPEQDKPTYEGREIVLGPRAGEYYIVRRGLDEGERVVTNGNFKIDSALQIMAKPSMMTPEGGGGGGPDHAGHSMSDATRAPIEFQHQLRAFSETYMGVQAALAADELQAAKKAADAAQATLDEVDMSLLSDAAHTRWMGYVATIKDALSGIRAGEDIEEIRAAFGPLGLTLAEAIASLGISPGASIYEMNCPMAFDNKGGRWLQASAKIQNPYLGKAMPSCGTQERVIYEGAAATAVGTEPQDQHDHADGNLDG